MMILGMILALIVVACAEYGARSNMKNFAQQAMFHENLRELQKEVSIYIIEMAVVGVCEDACSCLFFLYLQGVEIQN